MLDHHVRQSGEVGGEKRRFSLPHPLPCTFSSPIIPLYFLSLSPTLLVELYISLQPSTAWKLFSRRWLNFLWWNTLNACSKKFLSAVQSTLVQAKTVSDWTIYLLFLTFLYQGKGVFGNFERTKLNPIPNKKDDVSLEDLDVINFNFCFNTLMYNLYNIKFCY